MTQKRPTRKRLSLVPFVYRKWLLTGRPGAFIYLSRESKRCRSLWAAFGEAVCERYARRHPFRRPANFWRFNCVNDPRGSESQFDYLARHEELLFSWEKRRLAQQAQRLDQLRREF